MADSTGRDHNRFGMSVNQSVDVHDSGEKNSNVRAAHREWRCPAIDTGQYVRKKPRIAAMAKLSISLHYGLSSSKRIPELFLAEEPMLTSNCGGQY